MKTIKKLVENFHRKFNAVEKQNELLAEKDRIKLPDWKEEILRPIIRRIENTLGVKLMDNELRQYGLRCHVPLTFLRDGVEYIYLDMELQGAVLCITDFTQKPDESYPINTIGYINGFNLKQIEFPPTSTLVDITDYIQNNYTKFLIEKK